MREKNSELHAGMKGLSEGYEPSMLDVAILFKESCDCMSEITARICLIESKVLSIVLELELV